MSKVLFGMVIENLINCMSISEAAITYIYNISLSMQMQRCLCYLEKHFVVEMLALVDDPVHLGAVVIVKLQARVLLTPW